MSHRPSNTDLQRGAQRRVKAQMGFLMLLTVYIGVNVLLAMLAWDQGRAWNLYPLLGWGIGLAIHGMAVLLKPALHDHLWARALRDEASHQSEA